jgi:hypothetical protein
MACMLRTARRHKLPCIVDGFGASDTAANVLARNELGALQAPLMELNAWVVVMVLVGPWPLLHEDAA